MRSLRELFYEHGNILGLGFLFLASFLLRSYQLGARDFWYDEVATIGFVHYPWGNWNAPLYYYFLHYWAKLFAISEFSLRLPSVLFSSFSLIGTYFIGKELFNARVGLTAAVLMGLSPFHLWYAQEARDYSMVLLLGVCSTYFLIRAVKGGRHLFWGLFVLASLAGVYTNYFFLVLLLTQALILGVVKRKKLTFPEVLCCLVPVLGFSAYSHHFWSKFYFISLGFWVPRPDPGSLLITIENFILGYNGWPALYVVVDMLIAGVFVGGLWYVRRNIGSRQGFYVCLAGFLVPMSLIYIFSHAFFSIYLDRAFIIFSPFFYLALAAGIIWLHRTFKILVSGVLIACMILGCAAFFRDHMVMSIEHHKGVWLKKPVRPSVEFLEKTMKPGDMVAFTNNSLMEPWFYYAQNRAFPFCYLFDPRFPETDWQRPLEEDDIFVPYFKVEGMKFDRLWVVYADWPRDGTLGASSASCKAWLDKNLVIESRQEFDGMWLYRYARKKNEQ